MSAIDELMRQLDDLSDPAAARLGIAHAMLDRLHDLQASPRRWDKGHFANAVAALAMNINAVHQPTQAWLRLSVVDLRKAMDASAPDALIGPRERHLDAVTIEELITTIESLGDWH